MQATNASRRRIVTLATALFATLIIGVAFAAWTATGTGTGSAEARQGLAVTTTAVPATGPTLYPGGTADLIVQVNNPNPYPVRVTAINNRDLQNHPIATGNATCDTSTGVTFTDQNVDQRIDGGGSFTFTLTGAVAMSNGSHTACQGRSFNVPVEVIAASDAS